MKIIKNSADPNIKPYSIEQFSEVVERGERNFNLTSFGGEKSIQESAMESKLKGGGGVPVFASPPKKRKSLFSSFNDDDEDTGIFQAYTGINPHHQENNTESAPQADESASQKLLEQIFSQDLTESNDFQNFGFNEEEPQNLNLVPSQKDLVEKNAELSALEEQKKELHEEIENLKVQNSDLLAKLTELEEKAAEIPSLCAAAKDTGYADAKKEFDRVQRALYEADKADYLQNMEENWQKAIEEIKKVDEKIAEIDKDMPEIILSYVKEIVGTERKLNDAIIINVVKNALTHLKDLQQMVFSVNSADAQIIAEKFPQYGVSIDATVPKGSVKVRTKIGEVSLSIDNWMENLQKQIDEQLTAAKENQAQG
jgi:flagellar biosynthesis/type III secretory pathway protein FliH